MATTPINTILSWFQTGDFPTEQQFAASWSSFWHKDESIPLSKIIGINELFQQAATVQQMNAKANKDASNIDKEAFLDALKLNQIDISNLTLEEIQNL